MPTKDWTDPVICRDHLLAQVEKCLTKTDGQRFWRKAGEYNRKAKVGGLSGDFAQPSPAHAVSGTGGADLW